MASHDAGAAPSGEVLNIRFLLEVRVWFERLLELRTREARRRERDSVLEMEDEIDEENALRESLSERWGRITTEADQLSAQGTPLHFMRLAEVYALDQTELRILLLALMPALDTSFRMRIARFKDNILFNYVDVDLVTSLFFDDPSERVAAQAYLAPTGTLVSSRLAHLIHHPDLTNDDLINQEVRLPERIVNFLLGHQILSKRLAGFAQVTEPRVGFDQLYLPDEEKVRVRDMLARRRVERGQALLLVGGPGTGKTTFAEAVAHELDMSLLRVDCSRWVHNYDAGAGVERSVEDVYQEAVFHDAVVLLENVGALLEPRSALVPSLVEALEQHRGTTVLTAHKRDGMDAVMERAILIEIRLERPALAERLQMWRAFMPAGVPLAPGADIDRVAHQFDIPGGFIRNAIHIALNRALARDADQPVINAEDLAEGAHAQLRGDLSDLSERSRVTLRLTDLILPEVEMGQVQSMLAAWRNRQRVLAEWGFGKKLVTGRGVVALITGEPGTGKTLCAEILANELGLQLYQVSIPKIVSKWIGETEKNISTVFSKARATNAMLLFDEADALFTNRVEVKSSTDRYSNLEINSLLQEIERFDGIVLLTTNRDKDFDKAFRRRIMFQIQFPFPKPDERAKIWRHLLPPEAPLAEDVDFEHLARNFELAGGNIKNILLRAAYKAMDLGRLIDEDLLSMSAEEESRTAGRLFRMPSREDW